VDNTAAASRDPRAETRHNVGLLALCQALLFTNNSTTIAMNGLAGVMLAPEPALATVPVTCWVVGAALTTLPASMLMRRVGRRAGFITGASIGMVGAFIAGMALLMHLFWLLCAGTLILGAYNAFGQYYRFAAADVSPPEFKPQAISYVMAGGIAGGIIGPTVSRHTVGLFEVPYAGAYLSLIVYMLIAIALMTRLRIPPPTVAETQGEQRPLLEILRQPVTVVAILTAALGYGVMNFMMVSTPLEMTAVCGFAYGDAASVISAHVVGMFAPSFFTGNLIKRYGVLTIMSVGVFVNLICIGVGLAGLSFGHFLVSMTLLGIGWNFLFIGATTLLTQAYRPAERAKVQGANDLCIFMTTMISSLASGYQLQANGWTTVNLIGLVAVVVCGIAIAAYALIRRGQGTGALA
jgi:MFS family permease